MQKLIRSLSGALALSFTFAAPAFADSWPEKPVRYIVPYAAGGTTDELGRMVAYGLKLGKPVVVDNKPGQGGGLGMTELARSAPDGYTIGGGTMGSHVLNAALYSKLGYDPQKSFVPVVLLAKQPNLLVVNPALGVNSVQELIALLKKNPGKYSYGSSGNGSSQHIAGEMFKMAAGVDIQHIPYKGSSAILNDLLGGHIDLAIDNISASLPMARSGRIKALAVSSLKRSAAAPELPTLHEAGLTNFEMVPWHGVFAPAGTPSHIVQRLNKDINAVLQLPENKKKMADLGMEDAGGSSADLAKLLETDIPRMRAVVHRSGARID